MCIRDRYRLVRNTAHEWWGQFLEYDELQRGTYALSDDGTTLVLTSADGIGDTAFAVEAGTLPPKRFAAIMTEGASALPEEDTPLYLQLTERTSGESFYCRLAPELFYQESASGSEARFSRSSIRGRGPKIPKRCSSSPATGSEPPKGSKGRRSKPE